MEKLVFKVVIRKEGNAIPLSLEQHRNIPCLSLLTHELEERFFEIEFKAQKGVSSEQVFQEHIKALSLQYDIIRYEKFDEMKN